MSVPDVITRLLAPFNETGVVYMVTGGLAAIVYGEPRLTLDVDIVADMTPESAERIIQSFDPSVYYVPPEEVLRAESARASHGHFNLFHREQALRADVYVAGTDALARWALPRRRVLSVGETPIWIAPLEYVILMKLDYFRQGGSDRHLRDIAAMLRQSGDLVDHAVMDEWIHRLQLASEWKLARDVRRG
jgi:hypothetical protein